MSRKKKFLTAASAFSVALGIGFAMQNGDAVASRFQPTDAPAVNPVDVLAPQTATITAGLNVPSQDVQPLDIPVPVQLAALDVTTDVIAPDTVAPLTQTPTTDCTVTMDATTLPLAMVSLAVNAPCQSQAALTIHHQGMMFTLLTDDDGIAEILVPALATDAFFIASFADGDGAVSSIAVPELANFDRAVVQWQGQTGVQLHALEFGASYGADGHVWAAAAGDLDFVTPPTDGFLLRLGDDTLDMPLMAEVYTFPSGASSRDGNVGLSVEIEVTDQNCAQEIAAQSIQIDPASSPTAVDLTLTMPECDAIGEFLVLKNMFRDLTLAAK